VPAASAVYHSSYDLAHYGLTAFYGELCHLVKRRLIVHKNFLKLAVLFSLAVLFAVTAPGIAAQDAMSGSGGANPEAMQKLQKMSAALQLTPEQKKQVMPILIQEAPQIKALKADTSMPPLQKAMKMRQIGETTDSKMKPILNPQQWQTWETMRAQEKQQMMQKMENR
jgi:hypothetical protein